MLLLEFGLFSGVAGNAADFSGLSAVTYSLSISGMSHLVAPEPTSQIADVET